jgi:hypothetical protein
MVRAFMLDHFSCPKCGRRLERSGVVTDAAGNECPVFQCDECLINTTMFDEPVELALTFAVDPDGRPFDPANDDDGLILED